MSADLAHVSPPPPPVPITLATALLGWLKAEGVSHIFGIPGGAMIPLLEALKADSSFTYHICRQETGAAYIADGYARVSGGLAVVLTTSGPGAMNALTGAVNADASGTPLLVITGEIAEAYFGRGFLQEGVDADLDIVDVYSSAIGFSEMITNATNAQELFQSAMRRAWGFPRRAVHLSVPGDVAGTPIDPPGAPAPATYRVTDPFVDAAGIQAAVDAIAAARRPLIMLGDACRPALTDPTVLGNFVKAVTKLAVPVVTDPDAKGLFPETHALSLRNVGLAACEWAQYYLTDQALVQYDALVVLGSRLGELATDVWKKTLLPNGPFIQVDEDPQVIGRAYQITRGVVSEMTAAIGAFIDAAENASVDPKVAAARRTFIAQIKKDHSPFADPKDRDSPKVPIMPQALARILSDGLPPGSRIMVDAGNCVGWCLHEMVVDPPTQMHTALAMGPMGFGTASVIGAKLALPTAQCVAVVGDGGFLMQVAEVATAAQDKVGAIWVVLADHDLTMVSQGMTAVTGDKTYEDYYQIGWTDLAAVAQGLGATAYSVSTPAEVTTALGQAMAGASNNVPQVIVVTIDPTAAPPYDYSKPAPPPP